MSFGSHFFGAAPFGGSAVAAGPPDTTGPAFGAATLNAGTKTSTSVALSTSAAATDAVGVTGYEWSSDDGATYPFTSLTNSFTFTALTALTSYTFRIRAYDAAGNRSAHLSLTTSTYAPGATGQQIIDDTSAIPGVQEDGILVNDVELPADANKWFSYEVVTPVVDTASLTLFPNGSLIWTGTSADSFTYQLKVDGVDVGSPQLVSLDEAGPPDTEDPVLTGSITVTNLTTTSYDLSWPTGTDDTGVTGYEYSLNGGADWTSNGTDTTESVTGRTPGATDQVRVRCFDAAGNRSTPALSEAVTLLTPPPDPTPSNATKRTPNGMIGFWNR